MGEYMFPGLQGLPDEFRKAAAVARAKADAQPKDHFSQATKYEWIGISNAYLHAAQRVEDELNG
jgi:hypothetical protein